jgi:hypothetical protein
MSVRVQTHTDIFLSIIQKSLPTTLLIFLYFNRRILNAQLLQIRFILRRVIIKLTHIGAEFRHNFCIQQNGRFVRGCNQRLIFYLFSLFFFIIIPRMSFGSFKRSKSVNASTFAPAVMPLCAIGVAIETAFAQ